MLRSPAWRVQEIDDPSVSTLAAAIGVRPLTARVLVGRGVRVPDHAVRFLDPRLAHLRPPDGMADLDRACDRLATALGRGETIGVFGDYDVDGVTTAAIVTLALRGLGGARVIPRAASRASGYGLGPTDVTRFADEGCTVIVTGDCGTSDHEALAMSRARGIDAIVIDHHQVPEGESPAFALINPHRPDDRFPFKGLASCGVAFYLAAALRSRLRTAGGTAGTSAAAAFDPRDLLDLVALGSIADLVPLLAENRILVSSGLRVLSARRRPGLRALCRVAELAEGPLFSHHVSFRLTPRLNAAGRLGDAQAALDLLLAAHDDEAQRRAAGLDDQNRERQRIQEMVIIEAIADAEELVGTGEAAAVIVGREGWHQGVVGIVAAKLVDKYRRPAIVVGFEGGAGRGSARTVAGFNLFEALSSCRQHLKKFGGHAAAAGMSVDATSFPAFRAAFLEEARRRTAAAAVEGPWIVADAVVGLDELDAAAAGELARLGPFGAANAEPLLAVRGVVTSATRRVGNAHLQISLQGGDGVATCEAIAFGMADLDPGSGASVDVVACADLDTFHGIPRPRLRIKHLYRLD